MHEASLFSFIFSLQAQRAVLSSIKGGSLPLIAAPARRVFHHPYCGRSVAAPPKGGHVH